jgi:poly-gamma-glutamate system protein
MKQVYWRPRGISNNALLVVAAVAIAAITVVEAFPEPTSEAYFQQMLEASELAATALAELRQERDRKRLRIDPIADPTDSGLIGFPITEITTNSGNLLAKQTTINPNWAAVVVKLLREAGVEDGDTVAVGLSGSFPGLNVAVYAAMSTLRIKPLIISSASASQWGANHPDFLWLDMEAALAKREVIPFRSVAVSPGGAEDQAAGLSDEGKRILDERITRSGIPVIRPSNYAESVVERIAIYRSGAGSNPIRAYINVGGGTSSVGTRRSKFAFNPGINRATPPKAALIDSVMARFLDQGIPVIHFLQINHLARRYGLPVSPQVRPPVGTGLVFQQRRYNPALAIGALSAVVASLFLFIRSGRGRIALQSSQREREQLEPTL